MTIKDEILKELRGRTSIVEIGRKYRSQSHACMRLWSEMNLEDALIRPSGTTQQKDNNLETWRCHRLPVLIEFVREGLRQIMIEQSKQGV